MNVETKKIKISEMVLKFAGDYISMGETIEEKQNFLNSACSAWNISLLSSPRKKSKEIRKYIKEYKKHNLDIDDQDCRDMKENLEKLISEKEKLFPNESTRIFRADVKLINGKEHYNVLYYKKNS